MASKVKMSHIRKLEKIITWLSELENDLPESSDAKAQLAHDHARMLASAEILRDEFNADR